MSAVRQRGLPTLIPCLAISWLSVAPLYAFDVRPLPEPYVALVLATLAGVAAGLVPGIASGSGGAPPPRPVTPIPQPEPTTPVDPRAFVTGPEPEVQCPRCGGFAVTAAGATATCRTCSETWDPSGPTRAVVVRSWLHH